MSSSLGKVFLRGREHQLNPIQLVHLGCPWVVINCHNVRQGVAVAGWAGWGTGPAGGLHGWHQVSPSLSFISISVLFYFFLFLQFVFDLF